MLRYDPPLWQMRRVKLTYHNKLRVSTVVSFSLFDQMGEKRENFLGQLFRWHFCEAAIKMPQIAHNGDLERQGGGSLVDESGFQGNW